jgi:ATP-dependent Lhr-like helicase
MTVESFPFHPLVARWFESTFESATTVQRDGWRSIARGDDTLISAPTGSGKTLAAFLWAIDRLFRQAVEGRLEDRIHVVYVSPLKALGNDIEKNLRLPLHGVRALALAEQLAPQEIRVAVRSGDTPAYERQLQVKHPPHVLITTPESLYILLTSTRAREALRNAETVIVDEIHAVAETKRGLHLALSLERLDQLAGRALQRIGLSATQNPVEEVARLLVGAARTSASGEPRCTIVDSGHRRNLDLTVQVPSTHEIGPIPSHELRAAIYTEIAELVGRHRTTIVFTNTRRMVERVAHALTEMLGKDKVRAHHGSLSRATRLAAEEGLKSGEVPVVVATASLELGIDVGHVDLVCHLGAPRSIAQLLQRVGRAGHFLGAIPKGVLFPFTRDDLAQCAAAVRAIEAGVLDRLTVPENARDVLAQQIVATIAGEGEMQVDDLFALVRRAHPYRRLERETFDQVVEMLAEGVSTRKGRRSAHLHFDRVNARLRPRRGARLAAITSGGAIPDTADYDVIEDASGVFVGTVNEDFAVESLAGDIMQLGNRSWRIQRVEMGRVRVTDADGQPPTIPFWLGEAPGRTRELSEAVAALRTEVAARLDDADAAATWVAAECHMTRVTAEEIVAYVREGLACLGVVPTQDTIVAERFFDEAGGMQLVLHAPFGARLNRALGLALRKRFCVSFDFELQAAATDDGVVLSLGEQHSFPLDNVFSILRSDRIEADLVQASIQSPMFTNRWRWNASRALALLRFTGGKKVPVALQRMRAEDLMAAVFPAQLGCQDNRQGPIEPPAHPLVDETVEDCLYEAMDTKGARELLERIENGTVRTRAVETPSPSAFSHEILNANPYAYLDDAPLEERRARAVTLRRFDPDLAAGIGALDPAAIAEVRRQAWPEARDADEVHDALLGFCVLPERDAEPWRAAVEKLVSERRAVRMTAGAPAATFFVATERAPLVRTVYEGAAFTPEPPSVGASDPSAGDPDAAVTEIVRGWMDAVGPTTASVLAKRLALPMTRINIALARLESEGAVLQGRFEASGGEVEWCERGLLARIHRMTIGRLRKEIEPVSKTDFMRFLFRWQHVLPATRLHGRDGVRATVAQLEGLELPGPAWERDVLPTRIERYDPADLEQLCLSGEVAWGRLAVASPVADESKPQPRRRRRRVVTRSAPLALFLREEMGALLEPLPDDVAWRDDLSAAALEVLEHLESRGASFLADIARVLGRLPTQVEDALWELVASGLVTGDGIAGLRTLLLPDDKRKVSRHGRPPTTRQITDAHREVRRPHLRALPRNVRRLMPVGRWSLLRTVDAGSLDRAEAVTATALRLLSRWGVVFREIATRERFAFPWRALLHELRRLEACGEVRGGRFIDGFVGEQFALPNAVETLRRVRREHAAEEPDRHRRCRPPQSDRHRHARRTHLSVHVAGDRLPRRRADRRGRAWRSAQPAPARWCLARWRRLDERQAPGDRRRPRRGARAAPHLLVLRPNRAEVRSEGARARVVGVPQAASERARSRRQGGIYRTKANCFVSARAARLPSCTRKAPGTTRARRPCWSASSTST